VAGEAQESGVWKVLKRDEVEAVLDRLDLTAIRRGQMAELALLLGPDGRVSLDTLVAELFEGIDVASAVKNLDRRIDAFNEAAESAGRGVTAVLTRKTYQEPTRWLQFRSVEDAPNPSMTPALGGTHVIEDRAAAVLDLFSTPPPEPKVLDLRRVKEQPGGSLSLAAADEDMDEAAEPHAVAATRRPDQVGQVNILSDLLAWAEDDERKTFMAVLGEYGTGKTVTCQAFTLQQRQLREARQATRWPLYFDLRMVQIRHDRPVPKEVESREAGQPISSVAPAGGESSSSAGVARAPDGSPSRSSVGAPGRMPTVDEVMVECARNGWLNSADVTAADLWRWLGQGAIAIFDGLDEVLVKLDERSGQEFTDRLLSVVDRVGPAEGPGRRRPKVLISSRTEFFRSLREERNRFTGSERRNAGKDSYEARLLLPLTPEQVRDYLAAAWPERDIDQVMAMIAEVHDLTDLTQRPYSLRLVADAVPRIEAWREAGQPVYASTLYREFTNRWLERDDLKHLLKLHHKRALVQELAVELWRSGRPAMPVTELETWLHRWGPTQSDWDIYTDEIAAGPRAWREKLEEDLRNSTFLVREDLSANEGAFRFAHTSLQEFFLSEYLMQALKEDDPSRWERVARRPSATGPVEGASSRGQLGSDRGQIPVEGGGSGSRGELAIPGRETLAFLGQSLAELQGEDPVLVERMSWWFTGTNEAVDRVIVYYRRVARDEGWPATVGLVRSSQELRRFDRGTPQEVVAKIRAGEIVVGDRVALGGYVWRLLDAEKGLVLAEYPVDFRSFDKDWRVVSWAECSLREWLNGEFLASLLSLAEQRALIAETVVHTPDNPMYGTLGGPDVRDWLYLLSREEVEEYLPDPHERQPDSSSNKPRRSRRSNGNLLERPHRRPARVRSSDEPRRPSRNPWAWWWLRSPGVYLRDACAVSPAGSVGADGNIHVNTPVLGVRPAFRLNLESGL